ncbi:MAG: hypoxanthine phosphoribosyltransferase [Cyclobacteriaceae bacterium]
MISCDRIINEIKRLSQEISADYREQTPLILVVLNGAFMFAADLAKELELEARISFIKVSSYEAMRSTGEVKELIGLNEHIAGEDIILIEDIVDSGKTVRKIIADLDNLGAASVSIATLLRKDSRAHEDLPVKYVGFDIEDRFVVGYGLDFDGIGRNLKHIYVLDTVHD